MHEVSDFKNTDLEDAVGNFLGGADLDFVGEGGFRLLECLHQVGLFALVITGKHRDARGKPRTQETRAAHSEASSQHTHTNPAKNMRDTRGTRMR